MSFSTSLKNNIRTVASGVSEEVLQLSTRRRDISMECDALVTEREQLVKEKKRITCRLREVNRQLRRKSLSFNVTVGNIRRMKEELTKPLVVVK